MDLETRINNIEKRMAAIEGRMDSHDARDSLLIRDLNRLLDGTDENPGVLRKLDELKEIVKLSRGKQD